MRTGDDIQAGLSQGEGACGLACRPRKISSIRPQRKSPSRRAMRSCVRQQPWSSRVAGMPWAYRVVAGGTSRCACDDDGEFGAGEKLAQVLDSCKSANVLIGVTRQGERLPHCSHFSLTKFGQHRWPHFVGCARALLKEHDGRQRPASAKGPPRRQAKKRV